MESPPEKSPAPNASSDEGQQSGSADSQPVRQDAIPVQTEAHPPERGPESVISHETVSEPPPRSEAAISELLEQRLHRMEDLITRMQDTKAMEDRVAEKVTRRLKKSAAGSAQETVQNLLNAGRQVLPVAVPVLQASVSRSKPEVGGSGPTVRHSWLLWDCYDEARTVVRMFFDKRYRLSWTAIVVPLLALFLMLGSYFTIWYIPLVGGILDKIVDLILAFLAYKVLVREAQRYRQTVRRE